MRTLLRSHARTALFTAATLALGLSSAHAQSPGSAWGNNGYFSLNGLYDLSNEETAVDTGQTINAESASITATSESGKRPLYDVTAGGRLKGNLGFGFGVTYGANSDDARVQGSIPHPFYFNQPRTLDGTTALDRTDLMVHLSALWLVPFSERVQATVFGGPTWFQVKQQVIKSLTVQDSYPFDSVTLASVERERKTASHWGYHAGVDVSYFFSRYVGIQGMARYSAGTITIENTGLESEVKAGGLHAGVGLRIRY